MSKIKIIRQSALTPDCWLVQTWGLSACADCESRGKRTCGGKAILRKIEAGVFPKDGLPEVRT